METFGLAPLPQRAREAYLALRGGGGIPPTKYDVTSLGVLHPVLSLKTWAGWRRPDGRIPITNLFNRTPTPIAQGWSVRKTQVRDFRGGTLTYDSHNGTDFAIPPGTLVVAAAPGRVLRISSEFNRGGLKVFVDHGGALITTSNHLARPLVRVGETVARGQPIALSGYSGLDGLAMFPWSVPHVHFNVWFNGDYVDPFSGDSTETPLWRDGNDPQPYRGGDEPAYEPSPWNQAGLNAAVETCTNADVRAQLNAISDAAERAMAILFQLNYFPTLFPTRPDVFTQRFEREGRLTLPFRATDFCGITFAA